MKKHTNFLIFVILFAMLSCTDEAKISVQNNISGSKLQDITWGDLFLDYELLPGETSNKITVSSYYDDLPAIHSVSFKMIVNNKTIYLETDEEYLLSPNDDLLIVLSDSTRVSNPNE